jgi:probable rRNA maturation factor
MSRALSPVLSRKREKRTSLSVDVLVRSAKWKATPQAAAIVRKAVRSAAIAASTPRAELAIVLTDDSAIQALNRDWRGQDKPTNVLSFPAAKSPRRRKGDPAEGPLGGIVIARETVAREARSERKPLGDHLAHLAVHGFLHLVGYDHETARDAKRMEALEVKILAALGIPDPYAERSGRRPARRRSAS